MPTERSVWLADPAATEALGARLAAATTLPLTALARAWLGALGVRGRIKSPTYTLIERYPLPDGGLAWHLDLYRIADPEELHHLGLDRSDPARPTRPGVTAHRSRRAGGSVRRCQLPDRAAIGQSPCAATRGDA